MEAERNLALVGHKKQHVELHLQDALVEVAEVAGLVLFFVLHDRDEELVDVDVDVAFAFLVAFDHLLEQDAVIFFEPQINHLRDVSQDQNDIRQHLQLVVCVGVNKSRQQQVENEVGNLFFGNFLPQKNFRILERLDCGVGDLAVFLEALTNSSQETVHIFLAQVVDFFFVEKLANVAQSEDGRLLNFYVLVVDVLGEDIDQVFPVLLSLEMQHIDHSDQRGSLVFDSFIANCYSVQTGLFQIQDLLSRNLHPDTLVVVLFFGHQRDLKQSSNYHSNVRVVVLVHKLLATESNKLRGSLIHELDKIFFIVLHLLMV